MDFNDCPDSVILQSIAEGNSTAFNVLYLRYWKIMYIIAWNVLKDKEAVEDIVHEVFCEIWVKRVNLVNIEIPNAYLKKVVYYRVVDYIRHNNVRKQVHDELTKTFGSTDQRDASYIVEDKELVVEIERVLSVLPEQCRKVYEMRNADFTNKEIAERLNISVKTVERHVTLARKKIAVFINKALLFFLL